jgi:hypothetical protein
MLAVSGAIVMEVRVLFTLSVSTSSVAALFTPLIDAVTLVDPEALPVANPPELIEAIDELATLQVTLELTVAVEPSLYFAVAVNCCVLLVWIVALAGETESEDKVLVAGGVLDELGRPWHPVPAISKAREEDATTENTNPQRVACMDPLRSERVQSTETELSF